jgi:uncharacterized tellurite resistance protein B-like protein
MERTEKIQYLATLITLIRSDGKIHPNEEKLLFSFAKGIGAGFLFLDQAETLATSSDFKVEYPCRSSDSLRLFEDMLLLAHADAKLAAEEVSMIKDLLNHLQLSPSLVDRIKADVSGRYKSLT